MRVASESWPIAGSFAISRGAKTVAEVVTVTLEEGGLTGRGECVPYPRYGETVAGVVAELTAGANPLLKSFAARNALDCARWDLAAKRSGEPVWQLAGLKPPAPLLTAYTLSLDTPEAMAAAAKACQRPLLKLKLGRPGDEARLRLVRASAPDARLIVDANEGWRPDNLAAMLKACADSGVELVEQPLPAAVDEALRGLARDVIICADESAHGRDGLDQLAGKYDAINIKLDKTGGLTEALALTKDAQERGLKIMVGCMLATSLSMAPAFLVAQSADYVDLDGPLLLQQDREPGIAYIGSIMQPPPRALWG